MKSVTIPQNEGEEMLRVNIVGIGPGNPKLLTGAALEAISQSTILIGDKRMLANFASEKRFYDTIKTVEICNICANANPEKDIVSILVSGDVGFSALPKLSAASCRIVNVCVLRHQQPCLFCTAAANVMG